MDVGGIVFASKPNYTWFETDTAGDAPILPSQAFLKHY
jgi:hypothetical protein